jgi:hypothetical protein
MSPATATIELARTSLAVPLHASQIEAACRLHLRLKQWRLSDTALAKLNEDVSGFGREACLLKCVAVNTLYGTQVLAIVRMAEHVCQVMTRATAGQAGPEIVKQIAALPAGGEEKQRKFVSFAAKFCHFFIDPERFPIYDEAARDVLKLHLGQAALEVDDADPYTAFCSNLNTLRRLARIEGAGRNLDRYLWITGMYMKWLRLKGKPQMNVELRRLFETPTQDTFNELLVLLPPQLTQASLNGTLSHVRRVPA